MDIALNAEVLCMDEPAGHVSRVILNPIDDELTHLVVKQHGEEHEIDVSHVMSADEARVKLNCSTAYLREQPHFIETEYIYAPFEHQDLDTVGYYYRPYVTMKTYAVKLEHIPVGELAFTRGTPVFAKDGRIGRIDEFVVNPDDYHITHIVLREGHLWGHKDVVIGIEHIKNFDGQGLYLKMTRDQVAALPAIPLHRHYGRQPDAQSTSR